jgi:DNA-directed RNA polymerase subunit RPC12/RpoP
LYGRPIEPPNRYAPPPQPAQRPFAPPPPQLPYAPAPPPQPTPLPPPVAPVPAPYNYAPPVPSGPYRCPHCGSSYPPQIIRKMSQTGLIVLLVMIFVFFPLFWIGLLIKEDVRVCPNCRLKVG